MVLDCYSPSFRGFESNLMRVSFYSILCGSMTKKYNLFDQNGVFFRIHSDYPHITLNDFTFFITSNNIFDSCVVKF